MRHSKCSRRPISAARACCFTLIYNDLSEAKMCGIAGYYAKRQDKAEALVRQMSGAVQHHGPDNLSFFGHVLVSLGHHPLSVINLDNRST